MAVRLQLIDAFTSRPFAGNPPPSCCFAWPAGQCLQQNAAGMNLHGAAFAPQAGRHHGRGLGAALVHPRPRG